MNIGVKFMIIDISTEINNSLELNSNANVLFDKLNKCDENEFGLLQFIKPLDAIRKIYQPD